MHNVVLTFIIFYIFCARITIIFFYIKIIIVYVSNINYLHDIKIAFSIRVIRASQNTQIVFLVISIKKIR